MKKIRELPPITIPPNVHNHYGIPYYETVKRREYLSVALKSDLACLTKILRNGDSGDIPVYWSDHMTNIAREKGCVSPGVGYKFACCRNAGILSVSTPKSLIALCMSYRHSILVRLGFLSGIRTKHPH